MSLKALHIALNSSIDLEESLITDEVPTLEATPDKSVRADKDIYKENILYCGFRTREVIEELLIKREEISGQISYLNVLKEHLNESFAISLLELENKKTLYIAKLDLYFEEITGNLRRKEFMKRNVLEKEKVKLNYYLTDIDELTKRMSNINSSSKLLESAYTMACDLTNLSIQKLDFPINWLDFKIPEINYVDFMQKCNLIKESSKTTKSQSIQTSYEPEKSIKLKQCNSKLSKTSDTSSTTSNNIKISGIFSDHIHNNDSLSINTIKIYIPGGHPAFSNYYLARISSQTTAGQVLESISTYSGVSWDYLGSISPTRKRIIRSEISMTSLSPFPPKFFVDNLQDCPI